MIGDFAQRWDSLASTPFKNCTKASAAKVLPSELGWLSLPPLVG